MSKVKWPADFPRLETDRLVLRELTLDDTQGVFQNFSDPEVTQYLMSPFTRLEQAQDIINAFRDEFKQGQSLTWAVALKDGSFIGTCSCESKPGYRGEIGFDLARVHWGKGYMTEALRAVIAYGLETLGLDQIKAHTFLLNSRSIHLLKRLGFQVDGLLKESSWGDGKFWDEIFFSLHRKDWPTQ